MSSERFDDEILSAIIDGEADDATVAAVNADANARERLLNMQEAVSFVATPVTEAAPERRSASIAAALAAATTAPEVSSLAAARHAREATPKKPRQIQPVWIAVAAAVLAFVVVVPFLAGGRDGADTATDAAEDVVDDASFGIDGDEDAMEEAVEDAADSSDDSADAPQGATAESDAGSDTSSDEDAMEEEEADEGAMEEEDDLAADEPTNAETTLEDLENVVERIPDGFTLDDFVTVNNVDVLDSLVSIGSVTPQFTAGEAIVAGVNPDCVLPTTKVTGETPYVLAVLSPFAGDERLIFVEFADDGTTRVLEAEDCAPLR